MPLAHWLLALVVVLVWGSNFVVVALGLREIPPFMFAALRFALASLPWLAFVARPRVPWTKLAAFGVLLGAGQFGLLFLAMHGRIPPGLASLLMQAQLPFTLLLSVWLQDERIPPRQLYALAVAGAGIGVVAWQSVAHSSDSLSPAGVLLTLGAALAWSLANLVARSVGRIDVLGFVVWSSVFAVPPLLAMSALLDPPGTFAGVANGLSGGAWAAVAWQVLANTLFGFGVWAWLLARHPAATVTPIALLVPIVGMTASAIVLHEPLPAWKIAAAALVLAGVGLNVVFSRRAAASATAAREARMRFHAAR